MASVFDGGKAMLEKRKSENVIVIILSIILAYFTFHTVMSGLENEISDYYGHTYIYLPLFTGDNWIEGWKAVPYLIWHLGVMGMNEIFKIPLENSAAYMSCFLAIFSYFIWYWIIKKFTLHIGEEEGNTKAALISFGLCVLQSLHFEWMDAGSGFLGNYSMNAIHSATQMTARPFSLLCVCLAYDVWQRQKDDNYQGIFFKVETGLKKYYFGLAFVLFLTTCAKPTFAEMFIPALALIMLADWIACICRKDGSAKPFFKKCLIMLLCAVPALAHILVQMMAYAIFGGSFGGETSFVFTKWGDVWSIYSENIPLSVVLGMTFPLFMILINLKYFLKDDLGKLGLASYGVGFLEATFLGENGARYDHGNFIWPMMSGMLILWTVSVLRLLALERQQADSKVQKVLLNVAWFIFWLHVFYGILFMIRM